MNPVVSAAPDRSLFDGVLWPDPADPRRVDAYLAAPTVQSHASLLATLPDGDLGMVWFGGTRPSPGGRGRHQHLLVGLARSWAIEPAPHRITVNAVAPGPTATALLADPNRAATPPRRPALGRFVGPAEVAGLTAFLLGAEGGSITGQQLMTCGGASL